MKKIIFQGSGVALVTPMKKDGSIDYDALGNLIEFQIKNKTDAIISCGTTGESSVLTDKERLSVIDYTIKKTARRVPVIAGTGSNDTLHALSLSLDAQKLGADALLLVTPYYNKTSQKGLIEHYTYIADRLDIPIILYNVPSRTGISIKPETYKVLADHPKIFAIKEASNSMGDLAKTISLCSQNLFIYSGNDELSIPMLSLGGIGVISVFANLFPRQSHDIIEHYLEGNREESLKLFLDSLEVINALFCDVNPIPVKTAMNFIGIPCGKCRLPLIDMDPVSMGQLKETVDKYSCKYKND
ncbi:MAG: 4-hydroxy-tetrahydrodipicolinate synthase [Oscillospiraceae bacterium]|nr:4-hydroxy-tetrahydrodipicolinate synthase [Oscillospiraceae bacterium]